MNILRWHRKSNKKIRPQRLIFVIFSLIMTTFAWFAYSKILDTSLNIHMTSWDMEYYIGEDKKTNPISIDIPVLYPTMSEKSVTIDIKNNGEALVDIEYYVEALTIIGDSYEILQEGESNNTPNYIKLTPSVIETDTATGTQTAKGVITNDLTKFPFTIEVEHSPQVQPRGQGYLTIKVNWIGDNDELDTQWGYRVGEYLSNNPSATAMSIQISINSYQADRTAGTIIEPMPSTSETTPYLPNGFYRVPGTNLDTGLVIKDSSGNEYVWVEVPKTELVYDGTGIGLTELTETDYTSIETDLKAYTSTYRNVTSYIDEYPVGTVYRAVGLNIDEYIALKNKMLESIYKNGGFYIGRYETGVSTFRTAATPSTPTDTPIIKANAYPFNYITCAQSQTLASTMASGQYTSSLMFGIQWDLVLKYLETKGTNVNSSTWGNYNDNLYYITNPSAKYYNTSWNSAPYEKTNKSNILLSTGANSRFSKQNISDLAGNLWEWTLEYSAITGTPSAYRGSAYDGLTTNSSAITRAGDAIDSSSGNIGFRVTIY